MKIWRSFQVSQIINWLEKILGYPWAIWRSFQVSQNIRRLIFLREKLDNKDVTNSSLTIQTWRIMVNEFLFKEAMKNEIFPLDMANDMLSRSGVLIAVGERLFYGTNT